MSGPQRKRIVIETKVNEWQAEFSEDPAKTVFVVGGVASGKSFACADWLIDRAHEAPRSRSAIISATHKQAKDGTLITFKERLEHYGYVQDRDYRQNLTDLSIEMKRGPIAGHVFTVWKVAGEAYRGMGGLEFDSIWADELHDWRNGDRALAWIFPRNRSSPAALRAYHGQLQPQFRGSSNAPDSSYHWLNKQFLDNEKAADDTGAAIKVYRVSIYDNYLMERREEYIAEMRAVMSDAMFRNRVLGEVTDVGVGRAYTSYFRLRHVATPNITVRPEYRLPSIGDDGLPELDPSRDLLLTHDFGVNPRVALICQRHPLPRRIFGFQSELVYVLDEIYLENGWTDVVIAEVVRRYPAVDLQGHLIHYGDPAGTARNSTTGESDWGMLRNDARLSGYRMAFRQRDSAPPVVDRVASTNAKLLNADGEVGVLIHPRCTNLAEDLGATKWIEGTRQLDHGTRARGLYRTHCSDALGYLIEREYPLTGYVQYIGVV